LAGSKKRGSIYESKKKRGDEKTQKEWREKQAEKEENTPKDASSRDRAAHSGLEFPPEWNDH
jgi:hypothetical protein